MGAQTIEELVTWQLADELRRAVIAFTAMQPAKNDWKYCSQIRDAADSACANTVEGYERRNDGDFLRFLAIAKGSLGEVQDRLKSARQRAFLNEQDFAKLSTLAARAIGANVKLQLYLKECQRKRRDARPKPTRADNDPTESSNRAEDSRTEDLGPRT